MLYLYPFFLSFFLVFMSELGDKTQLLVLSFSSKIKSYTILLGVALGSFFSHGIAIFFGSALGSFDNIVFQNILKFVTYISFLFFGIITLINKENDSSSSNSGIIRNFSNLRINYIFIIAFSIAVGELGDKTFLASIGLGVQYPNFKLLLVFGAIMGMVISDLIAIIFGKYLSHKISSNTMNIISSIIFLAFGVLGIIGLILKLS